MRTDWCRDCQQLTGGDCGKHGPTVYLTGFAGVPEHLQPSNLPAQPATAPPGPDETLKQLVAKWREISSRPMRPTGFAICADELEAALSCATGAPQALLIEALRKTRERDEHCQNCRIPDCRQCADLGADVVRLRCAALGDEKNPPPCATGEERPLAEADVQLLAWALTNCHTLARRALARTTSVYDREKWEHVLRICEKAGARSKGVLRASLPTEITEGGA